MIGTHLRALLYCCAFASFLIGPQLAFAQNLETFRFSKDLSLKFRVPQVTPAEEVSGQVVNSVDDRLVYDVTGNRVGKQYQLEFFEPGTDDAVTSGRFSPMVVNEGTPQEWSMLLPEAFPKDIRLQYVAKEGLINALQLDSTGDLLSQPGLLEKLYDFELNPQEVEGDPEALLTLANMFSATGGVRIVKIGRGDTAANYAVVAPGYELQAVTAATTLGLDLAPQLSISHGTGGPQPRQLLLARGGSVIDPDWDQFELQPGCAERIRAAFSTPLNRVTIDPADAGCTFVAEIRGRVPDFGIVDGRWSEWHYRLVFGIEVYLWPAEDGYSDVIRIGGPQGTSVSSSTEDTDQVDRPFSPINQPVERDLTVFGTVTDTLIGQLQAYFGATTM